MSQENDYGIVGRSEPIRRIRAGLSASADGRRSAIVVSGEAGMGKTSLIRAALGSAPTDSRMVGWGTSWHGDGAPGFWPWTQALGDLVRVVGLDEARAAAGQDREILSSVIAELGSTAATVSAPVHHRLSLLDAVVNWLEALALDRHVVIVLDDLQWADSSTLDLLDHVIVGSASSRLLVVGAYRHDEVGGRNPERLAGLGARAEHIHLEGLSIQAVEELVARIADPHSGQEQASELHRRSGGHPLFVTELARLAEHGTGGVLPPVVTGAVDRRLKSLNDESREVLDVASVLGNRLLPDVLGAVLSKTPLEVLSLLGSVKAAGLVRGSSREEFWFTHDLFRETLYAQLDPVVRSQLHGRVGSALEARAQRGGSVAAGDLAFHFAEAAGTGDPLVAFHWARIASTDERRRSAFAEAAEHLSRARSAALDAGWSIEPEVLVRLLIDEADSRARSGEPDVARDLLVRAASIAPDPRLKADVGLSVQRLGAKFAAPRDEIIAHLESALDAVTGVDLARQAQLTAALARELQHSVADDRRRAGPLSEEALALGRETDDDTLIACLLARHDALWTPGTATERVELGREIAAVGGRLRDTDRAAEGLILEANGLLESGSPGFRPVLDRWFGLLEDRNEPLDGYMVTTRRAALALLEGDTSTAEMLIYQAANIGERIHEPDTGNVLMSQRVALARARNDPAELGALAVDAVQWWTGAPVLAHSVAAGALAAAGDLEGAALEVAMVSAAGGWQSEDSYLRSVLVAHLAEAATAIGDNQLCATLLDDIAPLVDSCGVNGAIVAFAGPFAHTAGILSSAVGDDVRAAQMLRQSIDTAQRLGAFIWVMQGESALLALGERGTTGVEEKQSDVDRAVITRVAKVWTVSWREECGSLPHTKGLADIAILLRHRGQDVSALRLAGGITTSGGGDQIVDLKALDAYRSRLNELTAEIDKAQAHSDLGRTERLELEHEQLIGEIRRATGLGGRARLNANGSDERARKAVSARIRDAIGRMDAVAPMLAAHLNRSIKTGLQCCYAPDGDDALIRWMVEG